MLSDVLKDYTFERVELIVAANISALNYDGRISRDNKAWANKIMSNFSEKEYNKITECCYVNAHAGLIDMLAKAVQKEADRAIEKEQSATAENKNSTYEIYQIPSGEQYHDLRFLRYEQLEKFGQQIDPNNYEKVYSGSLDDVPYENKLEGIYTMFNTDHPNDFKGRSLSVSDIVVINDENGSHAHYVDAFGYKEVTKEFLAIIGTQDMVLAEKLNDFIFEYDTYGYMDNLEVGETKADTLNKIKNDIISGEVQTYIPMLKSIIENDDDKNTIETAKMLVKNIEDLTRKENSPVGNSDNEKSSENSCEALLSRLEEIREWASSVTEALDSLEKDIQEIKTR